MAYVSFDPWLQKAHGSYRETSFPELERVLSEAEEAWNNWTTVTVEERCRKLDALADTLDARQTSLAGIMASEMGKPVSQGIAEIVKCALCCRYYAEKAPEMIAPERRESSAKASYIFYEPQGIILGIMPWNFPFWQVFRFMVPALAGGNAVLLKHASNVPQCALAIEELVALAGFPDGIFRTLFPSHQHVANLISDPRIRGVSLTGSNSAGMKVAIIAGQSLKKIVMELGGSDPFIVFPDASLDKAVDAAVFSRFQNGGQSCIAAKRLIIHNDIYTAFREKFLERTRMLRAGDPRDPETEIGPMVSASAADELDRQLRETVEAGAKLLCGGRYGDERPALFLPAVVEEVPLASPLACEEVFGPVAPLFRFTTTEEAVMLANKTPFGLGATIWTADEEMALNISRGIDTGTVAINGFVKSEPGLPFGGVKESGYGRELSVEGIREFLNVKTVNLF